MALTQRNCAFLLVFVVAVYMDLYQAQVIIGRCRCRVTVKFVKGNMTDFQVLEKSPGCDKTEVIVTMSNSNSTTDICLNTDGKLAKAFMKCWERINKDDGRRMECIERKRKAEEPRASED